MNAKDLFRTALALAAIGTVLTAQEAKKLQEPSGASREAAATKAAATELKFSVTGLTKDNLSKVKDSLTSLSFQTYVCSVCKYEQSAAGKCTKCNMDLKAERKPLLAAAMPSADDSTIALTVDLGHMTRFSEIESALKKNAIGIDYSKLPIPGKAYLVIRGGTADNLAAVEKAIANLFQEARATWDAAAAEIRVEVRAATPGPTRAAVL